VDANGNPLTTDQRGPGFPRTVNGAVDVGAFEALDPVYDLQTAISTEVQANPTAPTLTIGIPDDNHAQAAVNAIDRLDQQNTPPITLVLDLAPGNYSGETVSAPSDVTLIINGSVSSQLPTTVDPATPAFVVQSGHVTVNNVIFTESGAAPTLLVTGGSLTLRNDVVQSSTGFAEPAIAVSGGSTLDLGTAASPGGNTIIVNGGGQVLASTGLNFVTALGNTFQVNGATTFPVATVAVASSANPSLLNQPVTFRATVSAPNTGAAAPTGTVTFVDTTTGATLGVASLSGGTAQWSTAALAVNAQTIAAIYSGDANYITSTATVVQAIHYHFSGFLAPLHPNMTYAAGRTIPVKFQLTDYTGASVTRLSAVTSLQVINQQGSDVLAGAGKTGLRYDASANQFVYNWQTKGLAAGTYTVRLSLDDGTTDSLTLTLSSSGAFQLADGAVSGYVSSAANQVLYGTLSVAVEDDTGAGIDPNELARISDAMAYLNTALGPFGVSLSWAAAGTVPDVTIHFASSTPEGGAADGVLGFTTADNDVYLVEGWSFYTGSDATQVGAGQYDFQTLAEHELAHTVGLGESIDPNSVMYEYLSPGTARRSFTAGNLSLINTDADRYMKVAGSAPEGALLPPGQPTAAAPGVNDSWNGLPGGPSRAWALASARIDSLALPLDGLAGLLRLPGPNVVGDERLKLAPDADVLIGGRGDDVLIGGGGRDLLVGGYLTSQGTGPADDALVLGTAVDDAGPATQDTVLQRWGENAAGAARDLPLILGDGQDHAAVRPAAGEAVAVYGDVSGDLWDGDGDWLS
jgi:hypothetical protein